MNKKTALGVAGMAALLWAAPAPAGPPKDPLTKCAPDAVVAGTVCMDKYEASVWRVPNPTTANAALVKNIKKGKATQADLTTAGATQLGTASNNYAPCADNGQNCTNDIYAVSLPGVTPASRITWFQAQAACLNVGKRLPTSAEWQVAVMGTPDSGPDNGTTDCNSATAGTVVNTGSRSNCVSAFGAFDMVGNLDEWVANWVVNSTNCPGWGAFSNDQMCFAGAGTTSDPSALVRGGDFIDHAHAGPLHVDGTFSPHTSGNFLGFRCAR